MIDGVCVGDVWCCVCCGERGGIAEAVFMTRATISGACGVSVAESVLAPPGPIPNPVVTQYSAGEYCSGNAVGGEAAAGTSQVLEIVAFLVSRGGAEAARWAHNPKVGGSNPPPATSRVVVASSHWGDVFALTPLHPPHVSPAQNPGASRLAREGSSNHLKYSNE